MWGWGSLDSLLDTANSWTAIPLAVFGFSVTVWHSWKARSAAELAKTAAQNARDDVGRASLLVLMPQLHRVEEQLERAVRDGSMDLAISWLNTWRWQAGQVRGLLDESDALQAEVMASLQASIVAATSAKSRMIDQSNHDVIASTKSVRQAISKVTGELGGMASTYGMQAGVSND